MIQRIRESDFIRNILVLFSGSLLSQLIPFFVLPILQKYFYSPADFGLLAVFISFSELFSSVASGKLEYGIVLQDRERHAINLFFGALKIVLIVTVISSILVLIFRDFISNYLGEPRLNSYLFLLPVYIIFFSITDLFSYWNNRKRRFKVISWAKLVQTGTSETVKLLAGVMHLGVFGLILGRLSGFIGSVLYYVRGFLKRDSRALKLLDNQISRETVRENKKFLLFTTPSVFLGNLINVVYLQLFLVYFGEKMVGIIGVSMTYLSAGFGVVAVSFSQVFYSRLAETKSKEDLLRMYIRFAKNLALLAFIPVAVVYLIPGRFVANILGEQWIELMPIARIMVVWLAAWFVSSSLSFIFIRLQKQQALLYYDVLHLIVIVSGFFIGRSFSDQVESALWGFSIARCVFYIFVIGVAIRMIKKADENTL
ncbi:oligosaccharide flippase family protein [Fluviicola sp.]|uniref:lipopolysaccharide biosynthesis protein n=1 Tax=Fluviicola sp. TaxID=1917219 RepID=UPI0031D315E4